MAVGLVLVGTGVEVAVSSVGMELGLDDTTATGSGVFATPPLLLQAPTPATSSTSTNKLHRFLLLT